MTRILTPDNLKTGVIKNTKDETVVNKSYQEMAEHYGTAIIPARPRKPKDKAFVEGSVGVVSTWILAALRNQQFLSLKELNIAIQEKLTVFNNKPFQKKEGSRAELFQEEQLFLLPLPPTPFELAVWKVATPAHVIVSFILIQRSGCGIEHRMIGVGGIHAAIDNLLVQIVLKCTVHKQAGIGKEVSGPTVDTYILLVHAVMACFYAAFSILELLSIGKDITAAVCDNGQFVVLSGQLSIFHQIFCELLHLRL